MASVDQEPESSKSQELNIEDEYVIVDLPPPEPKAKDSFILQTALEHIESWKKTNLNLAIIGCPSNDKASLIAHLSGKEKSPEKADVCFPVSTTSQINNNFIVWDLGPLPSCGASDEMAEFTKKHISSTQYDFYIICSDRPCLSNSELHAAQKLSEAGKNFCVVHFFEQPEAEKSSTQSKEEIMDRITQTLRDDLSKVQASKAHVFSVSSNFKDSTSLNQLYTNLTQKLDAKKLHTFLYSIGPWFKEIIIQKTSSLRSRIYYIAILNCLCGIFVPELAITVDVLMLSHELWFYLDQLGLSSRHFKILVETKGVVLPRIKEIISRSKYEPFFSADNIRDLSDLVIKYLPFFLASNQAVSLAQRIPLIGSLVGGAATFLTTKYALDSFLNEFHQVAMSLNDLTCLIDEERVKLRIEQSKKLEGSPLNELKNQT